MEIHFKYAPVVAAAALLGLAAPVGATETTSSDPASPTAQAQTNRADARDQRRICLREGTTGTRIRRWICKTAAEWQAEGVDTGQPR